MVSEIKTHSRLPRSEIVRWRRCLRPHSLGRSRASILDRIGYRKKVLAKLGQTDDDKKNDALVSAMNAGLPDSFRNLDTGFNYLHTRKSSTGRRKWKSRESFICGTNS